MDIISYLSNLRAQFICETGKDPTILLIHGEPAHLLAKSCDDFAQRELGFMPSTFQGMDVHSEGLTGDYIAFGYRYPYDATAVGDHL